MAFDMESVLVVTSAILVWSMFASLWVQSWALPKQAQKASDRNRVAGRPHSHAFGPLRPSHLNSALVRLVAPAATSVKASSSVAVPTSLAVPRFIVSWNHPHNIPQCRASSLALVIAPRMPHKNFKIYNTLQRCAPSLALVIAPRMPQNNFKIYNTLQRRAPSSALVIAPRMPHINSDISILHFDSTSESPAPDSQQQVVYTKMGESDVPSNLWLVPANFDFTSFNSTSESPAPETQQQVVYTETGESDVPSNLWLVPANFDFTSFTSEPAEVSPASSSSGSSSPLPQFSPLSQDADTTTSISSPGSTQSYGGFQFQQHEQDHVHQSQCWKEKLELEARVRELSAENNILKKRVNTQHRFIEIGFTRLRAEKSETEKWKSLAGYSVDPFSYRAVPQWQEEPAAHDAYAEINRLESHLDRQDSALHSSRQEIHRLEEVVEEKDTKITMLNNEIEQWQTRGEQARTFVEGLVIRYNWLEKHCVNPVTAHQQLADECFSLRHENQNMQLHLEYFQNRYNALLTDRNNLHALYAARDDDLREAIDEYSELDAQKYNLEVANSKLEAEKRQLKVANTRLSVQKRKMKVATIKRTAKFRKLKADVQAQVKKLDAKRKSIKTCPNKVMGEMKNDEWDASRSGEKPQAELRDCQTANESSDGADFFEHVWAPLPQPLPESYRVYRSHEEDDIDEDDEDEESRNDGGLGNLVSLIDMLMLEDELDLIT